MSVKIFSLNIYIYISKDNVVPAKYIINKKQVSIDENQFHAVVYLSYFFLLCITIFKSNLNTLLILNFSLRVLAKLSQQSLLGAAVNIDLFIVDDCDWESFSPLCIITFYCHIKRKRNQNWLVVQLYCLVFHHGQTELSPLIPKNFFLLPLFFLCIRTFILLVSCLFMAYFICDINFSHP